MFSMIAAVTFILGNSILSSALPENYSSERADFLHDEEVLALGGNLTLEIGERSANDLLMTLKRKEIDSAFLNFSTFLPAKNFLQVIPDIEKSPIMKIIKKMPKGAVLHVHDSAMVSSEWVYQATFRENLYICDEAGKFSLHFFIKPTNDCNWKLLSGLRKDPKIAGDLNEKIRQKLTMVVPDPIKTYPDSDSAWAKIAEIFKFRSPLLTYRPLFEDYHYEGLRELYEDNVMYVESRTTLRDLYELDGTIYKSLEVIQIHKNVTDRFKKDHPDFIGAKLIYAPSRKMPINDMKVAINKVLKMKNSFPNFFAGFDLVDQEDRVPSLTTYADELRNISDEVGMFFHAGETNWYGVKSDENLIDAILLNAKRVGHGFAILKHPKVLAEMKRKQIAIEVCPISNQVLGFIKDMRNHPASVLFAEGFPVVVSNDDPGHWGSKGLSYDFYEAFMGIMSRNADLRALKQLAMNSITYSTLNDDEKKKAMELFYAKWAVFIDDLNNPDRNNISEFSDKLMGVMQEVSQKLSDILSIFNKISQEKSEFVKNFRNF